MENKPKNLRTATAKQNNSKPEQPAISPAWQLLAKSCESGFIEKIEIITVKKRKHVRNPHTQMMEEAEPEISYNCNISFKHNDDSIDFDTFGKTIAECVEKVFAKSIIEKLKEASHDTL